MKVKVRYFAYLRELASKRELELDIEPGLTVGDLKGALKENSPHLAVLLDTAAVAVNGDYAPYGLPLQPGDEVAFLPPFSGGGNVC